MNERVDPKLSKQSDWDPLELSITHLSIRCTKRILQDVEEIRREPLHGIMVHHDEEVGRIDAIISGLKDSAYEGGFFHFLVRCTPDYPLKPPKARLLTTGNGRISGL